jgi:hypothetical protein
LITTLDISFASLTEVIKFLEVLAPFFLGSVIEYGKYDAILQKAL